ncbi:hypothetical protein [Streptomyces longispororuber]|uniref:hypothetical protein n=1 Tax=Streptomyces longispororuber TaxID=68230 RepID=UPI00210A688A|nr:hypothetical protein [Streptomyces longispororuber]MCQ4205675.1 hypothetical protein [Streptomyces longispororuber]
MMLFTLATACDGPGNSGAPGDRQGPNGDGEQQSKTTAFPDQDVIVTASCSKSTDDQPRVTVTGWDAQTWEPTASRTFPVPAAAMDDSGPFTTMAADSSLTELCGNAVDDVGVTDDGPRTIPESSLRQLFDKGYTRMAVVLMDRETEATRVGYVDTNGKVTELSADGGDDFADAPHEENAVFSGDGSAVWFTEFDQGTGTARIASRSVSGDHARKEQGSGAMNSTNARLALVGNAARGIYGMNVRISPDERKAIASLDGLNIVDLPQRSAVLGAGLDGSYISYDIDCYGWVDKARVLCGPDGSTDDPKRQNSFWTLDTSGLAGVDEVPDDAMGKPIIPATDRENTVQAISPDGKKMIFASLQGTSLTHFLSPITPGASPKRISESGAEEALSTGYVLEWR